MDNDQHLSTDDAPADLERIEAINNIDTARMALRWALERIHALQALKEDAERKAATAATGLRQADADRKDVQRVLELRNQEDAQRASYYARLEAYLSQHFAGKLDLAALIKRETQVSDLEALLQSRQLQLEKEHAARREKLEAQLARSKFEAQQAADEQVARAKAAVQESRQNLERSFGTKLAELTDKEVRLKAEAEALAQRQAQFESFCREQRAKLELDIQAFHDSVEEQMQFRLDSAERFLASRHDAAASTWQRQKAALLQEIDHWREQTLADLPRLAELEKRLASAQESVLQAQNEAAARSEHLQAELRASERERTALCEEAARLRSQREIDIGRLLELERQVAQVEEERNRSDVLLLQEKRRAQELEGEMRHREADWNGARGRLEQEKRELLEAAQRRVRDTDELQALLLGRFQDLEDEIHQRDLAWKQREELLRTRDRDWHVRLSEWQAQLQGKAQQLEDLKSSLLKSIQSYKARLGDTES